MFNRHLLSPVILIAFVCLSCQSLFAMTQQAPTPTPSYSWGYGYGSGLDPRSERIFRLKQEKRDLEYKLNKVEKALRLKAGDGDEELTHEKGNYDAEIEHIKKQISGLEGAKAWDWVVRPLAGKGNSEYVQGAEVEGWGDALKVAVGAQFLGAIGESVNSKLKTGTDSLFESFARWAKKTWADLDSSLFHDGKKPFDGRKLVAWMNMILDSLNNIGSMLENGQAFGMRNMDMTSRQSDTEEASTQQAEEQEQIRDVWVEFATIHAEEYKFFIIQMQQTKEYYEAEDIVITYADKICQMLAVMYTLLKESKSFKDFNSKLSSNKLMVKSMHSYLSNYFKYLIQEICLRAGEKDPNINASGNSSGYRGFSGNGFDSGFNSSSFSGTSGY